MILSLFPTNSVFLGIPHNANILGLIIQHVLVLDLIRQNTVPLVLFHQDSMILGLIILNIVILFYRIVILD